MSFKSVLIFPTSLDNMAVSGLGGRESPLNKNKRKKRKKGEKSTTKKKSSSIQISKSILEIQFLKNELR